MIGTAVVAAGVAVAIARGLARRRRSRARARVGQLVDRGPTWILRAEHDRMRAEPHCRCRHPVRVHEPECTALGCACCAVDVVPPPTAMPGDGVPCSR